VVEPALPAGAFGAIDGPSSSLHDLARLVGLHVLAWPQRDDPDTGPIRRSSLREMALAIGRGRRTWAQAGVRGQAPKATVSD